MTKSNSYNIDIPFEPLSAAKWTIFKFDPFNFLNINFENLISSTDSLILKSVTFNSTILIRGIFISNLEYDLDCMPKEMQVKNNDLLQFKDSISKEDEEEANKPEKKNKKIILDNSLSIHQIQENEAKKLILEEKKKQIINFDSEFLDIEKKGKNLKEQNLSSSNEDFAKTKLNKLENSINLKESELKINQTNKYLTNNNNLDLKETNNDTLKRNVNLYFKF